MSGEILVGLSASWILGPEQTASVQLTVGGVTHPPELPPCSGIASHPGRVGRLLLLLSPVAHHTKPRLVRPGQVPDEGLDGRPPHRGHPGMVAHPIVELLSVCTYTRLSANAQNIESAQLNHGRVKAVSSSTSKPSCT